MRADEGPKNDTVLVVEDDRDIRQLLCLLVEGEFGLDAREAEDGAEALRMIAEAKPRLVVTDVRMPNLDGIELVRRLRLALATRGLPILVVSASVAARDAAMLAGADDFVDKPFNADLLACKIRQQLSRVSAAG